MNWNGSPRTTTFVNSSVLTAAISASDIATAATPSITVVSPAPGGGVSNSQRLQVENALSQLYFTSADVTGKVSLTASMVGGDFNNDGKLDLVAAIGSTVYVIPGNGDGSFQGAYASPGPAGTTITGISVADINGDGKLDIIVTGSKSTSVSFVATMLGNGNYTFQAPIESDFSGIHFPTTPVLADFNGDGALDLAFTSALSVQTLLGNGDGTFRTGPSSPLNQIALSASAVGDFNNDGKLDLVVCVYDPFTTGLDYVGVMNGNGDGSFGALAALPGSGSPYVGAITAAVGDFNGDGNLDIATGIQTVGATIQGILQISLGNGNGTFQSVTNVPNVISVTTPLLVGDFNGDGNLDLVTGGYGYFGQGNGTFPTSQGSAKTPTYVFAGDFNNDGQLDLVGQTVTLNGTSAQTATNLELQIPPLPDFRGIASPLSATLVPGKSVSFTVTLQPLNGFTGDVIVGVSNVPAGITPSYNPVLVKGGNGTSTITLTAASGVPLGDYSVTLTGNSGSITHSSTLPLVVNTSVGDWSGFVEQQAVDIAPGAKAQYVIDTAPINGFNGNISLSVAGLPPGATASFNPASIVGGAGFSTLTVQTAASNPQPQIYNLTATGTNGILVHNVTLYLGVSANGGDFVGAISPSSSAIVAGANASYTLSVTSQNGGAGDLALSVTGLPPGATATFAPSATITASSGSSTLTISTPSNTPPGTYLLTVTSSGSGVIHQGGATLIVNP